MTYIQHKAPEEFSENVKTLEWPTIFLSGSIEQDKADRWQDRFVNAFEKFKTDVILLNPRRDNWDATITQSKDDPKFKEQVMWELKGLTTADFVVFYFDPNTMSPITLLELGLYLGRSESEDYADKMFVCCPKGYWRRGNIEVVCEAGGITLYETLEEMIEAIQYRMKD